MKHDDHGHSSYIELPNNKVYKVFYAVYLRMSSILDPLVWLLDGRTKTILDVGCGQGYPMQLLKISKKDLKATGVDLFEEYLREAKKLGVYEKLVKSDVMKLPFKSKTFDTVICLQVIEHLPKKDGIELIKRLEDIAKYQVIVTTPLGYFDHPDMDHNKLQRHLSGWEDKDFEEYGYKVMHQSFNFLFGNQGLVHQNIPKLLKGLLFVIDKISTPLIFIFPQLGNYWIVAYKKLS